MLGSDGPTQREDMLQRLLHDCFYGSKLGRIASDEVLMRVAISGMTVNHGWWDACFASDSSSRRDCFRKTSVWHRPVSGYLPAARVALSAASFVHRGRNAVPKSSGIA